MTEPGFADLHDDLDLRAMHYACGDMEPADAADFEALLANDQRARDALTNAAGLLAPLRNGLGHGPHPDYRNRVRQRLQFPNRSPSKSGRSRLRMALVLVAGAAALVLLALAFGPDGSPDAPAGLASLNDENLQLKVAQDYATMSSSQRWVELRDRDARRKKNREELRLHTTRLLINGASSTMPMMMMD